MKQKNLIILLVGGAMVVALLAAGGYAGRKVYRASQRAKLVEQARQHVANGETKEAMACLEKVLRERPNDVAACRLMAQMAEAAHSPAALLWRKRVVALTVTSVEDRLDLTAAALGAGDFFTASNTLHDVSPAGQQTARFHYLAGSLAAALGQPGVAAGHFQEQCRLEPTNPVPRLALAVVQLQGSNSQVWAQARASLQQLSSEPTLGCQAQRELIADALRSQRTNEAVALAGDLVRQTNASFGDVLVRLKVLYLAGRPEFGPELAACQRQAASSLNSLAELARWEMSQIGPDATLAWLDRLPADFRTNQPVALLAAECRTALRDWRGLQLSLEVQDWGELECLRHAFLARSFRGETNETLAKAEWNEALKYASMQERGVIRLQRAIAPWNWAAESQELLGVIVNRYPEETWAAGALTQSFAATGNTRGLLEVWRQALQRSPSDPVLKNNVAMAALLVGANECQPHELAREVYHKAPRSAAYASTYAYSLLVQNKAAEALKVIEQLTPEELQDAAVVGYYGLILKAVGQGTKAKPRLEAALKGNVLPEERQLFEQARVGL
jgi:Flp pilus assembly protein TadD